MKQKFKTDSLDKRILSILLKDARTPYQEIARIIGVTGSAIHQRVQKLNENGIIINSQINIDYKKLGYITCAFIGIQVNLISKNSHNDVYNKIKQIPEITECHHITGKHSLFVKIQTQSNELLKKIIVEEIQSIPEVIYTETFLSLEEGFIRQLTVE